MNTDRGSLSHNFRDADGAWRAAADPQAFYEWQRQIILKYLEEGFYKNEEQRAEAARLRLDKEDVSSLDEIRSLRWREALVPHKIFIQPPCLRDMMNFAEKDRQLLDVFEDNPDGFRAHPRTGKKKIRSEKFGLSRDEPVIIDKIVGPDGEAHRGIRIEYNVPPNRMNGLRDESGYIVSLPETDGASRPEKDLFSRDGDYEMTIAAQNVPARPSGVVKFPVDPDWKALMAQPGGVEFRPPDNASSPVRRLRIMDPKTQDIYCHPQGYVRVDLDDGMGGQVALGLRDGEFVLVNENSEEAHMHPHEFVAMAEEYKAILRGDANLSDIPVMNQSANAFYKDPPPGPNQPPPSGPAVTGSAGLQTAAM